MPIVASAEEEIPAEETVTEGETATVEKTLPEKIVSFITENYTESSLVSLAVTVVVYLFYEIRKHRSLSGTIGVLNNNAVSISKESVKAVEDVLSKANALAMGSDEAIQKVLAEAVDIATVVKGYRDDVVKLLEEIRKSADEKQSLEETLHNVNTFLSTSKLATLELSNEVADLLLLANIPNAKKEELYSRHRAAVDAISIAETTEVKEDVGKEA
jgi:hypothetical protein